MGTKRILYVLLAIIIVLLSGFMLFLKVSLLNNLRISVSNKIYDKSGSEEDIQNKLALLIQSDTLSPAEAKKFKIAEIALGINENELANRYLKNLPDNRGRKELVIFQSVTGGKEDALRELPENPITSLGIILKAINTGDYSPVSADTQIGKEIVAVMEEDTGKTNQELAIANNLISQNQTVLSRLILSNIQKRHPEIIDTYILYAKSYAADGNYVLALNSQDLAISIDPSRTDLLTDAKKYAQKTGNTSVETVIDTRTKYLGQIQK